MLKLMLKELRAISATTANTKIMVKNMARLLLGYVLIISGLGIGTAQAQAGSDSSDVSATDFPVSVTDDRPNTLVFEQAPKSVASISVFGADLLAALGQQATGLSTLNHRQSAYLGEQTRQMLDLGEVHETDMELLTELNPDLIIGLRQYTEPFAKKFEEIGQFMAFDLTTYEDSERAIRVVSQAMGSSQQGQTLNQTFSDQLAHYQQQAPGGVSALLIWHWADTLYAFYDHYLTTDIMTRLNVHNLMGATPTPELKKPDSTVLSMEKLLRLNPDVILSFTGDNRPISYHPVWQKLKAVKNQRVYRINDQYVMPHGPIARDMVLREMAYLFYPQQFAKPDDIPAEAQAKPLTFIGR